MAENENKTGSRKLQIMACAREVFLEYGYRKTTIEDVAERMNITRSALYYYFRNKDDLFFALMQKGFMEYTEVFEKSIRQDSTTLERLELFCEHYVSHRNNFFKMYKFAEDDYPFTFELQKRIRVMSFEIQRDIIKMILSLDVKFSDNVDIECYSTLLANSLRGFIYNPLYKNLKKMKQDMVSLCRIFYTGLCGMPGQKA